MVNNINSDISTDDQTTAGENEWIGHLYDGINFDSYRGSYKEPAIFDQNFGGETTCFEIFSNSSPTSIYTETFSVRYRMNSNLTGLYTVNIGSDDGSRLSVDGSLIYNDWGDHSYIVNPNILINLSGNNNLVLDYYENGGGNRIDISDPTLILENKLTGNIDQNLCAGKPVAEISGDAFSNLPTGITPEGTTTGYQWFYSTENDNERIAISGAIEATFTPDIYTAPFSSPGTYYFYRTVKLSSANNIDPNPIVLTHESNPAKLVNNINSNISTDDQTTAGENEWIGHVYDGINFDSYRGSYKEPSIFDQNFGGETTCFEIFSDSSPTSIYTETFSVRYSMNSSLNGLYALNIGSDDGSRLRVDEELVYDYWSEHGHFTSANILIGLTGNSNLQLEYFESYAGNRIDISEPILIIENELTNNIIQQVCTGNMGAEIAGDVFNPMPEGIAPITPEDTGYQWTYSTINSNERILIPEATEATFTPNINTAPFNSPGTYYIYRNATLSSTNNTGFTSYVATHESNAAELIVSATPTAELTGAATICVGGSTQLTANFTGTGPWDVTATFDNTSYSFAVTESPYSLSVDPSVTTTYSITSITDANGCTNNTESSVTVTVLQESEWTGASGSDWNDPSNWSCNSLPTIMTNVIIPGELSRYPILNNGDQGLAKNVEIQTGASVEISNNTLQISGTITNSGSFNSLSGSIALVGSTAQPIPANTFKNSRIRNLTVNNSEGVVLEGDLEVSGIVRVESGNLSSDNFLKLVSNITQTALIDGSGNGKITGTVKMQRYLDNSFGYKYFSSPFQNSVVGDFAAFVDLNESFPNFYSYNENRKDVNGNDATGWEINTDSASIMNLVEGYALNFGDSIVEKTVEISGTVNNGNYSRTLYNNNRLYTLGFNLVGNPYPSPIDWNAASGWTKTNIDNAVYFFTTGTTDRYTGTYSSYVNGISSGDGLSSNIIPSMQGFFVHVSESSTGSYPVTGTLGMTNQVRINDFTQEFLKAPETDVVSLLRITAGMENNPVHDPLVIYFNSFAETSFEKDLDALKMKNTDIQVPNLYSITPGKQPLSINALPYEVQNSAQKVPLGLSTKQEGWMIIKLKDVVNLPSSLNVYLIDNEKRTGQNLSDKPTYKFYTKAGEYDNRFHLLFSETNISDPAVAFDDKLSVQTHGGRVYVKMNLEAGQSGTITASTVTGQVLEQKSASGQETIELQGIKSSGLYFISLSLNGEMFSKKIVIQK